LSKEIEAELLRWGERHWRQARADLTTKVVVAIGGAAVGALVGVGAYCYGEDQSADALCGQADQPFNKTAIYRPFVGR